MGVIVVVIDASVVNSAIVRRTPGSPSGEVLERLFADQFQAR